MDKPIGTIYIKDTDMKPPKDADFVQVKRWPDIDPSNVVLVTDDELIKADCGFYRHFKSKK